jgi:membrane-bound serine protease (ClpP class)
MYNTRMGRFVSHPSIFASAILAILLVCPLLRAAEQTTQSPGGQPAAIVSLVGEIDDYSRDDLIRRFERAKAMGAKVVIISIDSPGGMVTSSMEISRYLKRQDRVRTIAYVNEEAYSGAAMVAVACKEIWMAPHAPLGDCAPIVRGAGGLEPVPETERAKMESPVVDEFLDSARQNGYNPLLLAAMVSLKNTIYVVKNEKGEVRVVNPDDFKKLTESNEWKLDTDFDNINGPGKLATVRPEQAVTLGLAKGIAPSATALVNQLGDPLIADFSPGTGEKLIEFLNNAFVRMILLTIFLQSLYIAIHAPGHGAAEATALVSLSVLLGIPLLTGYAQWWEIAVIFVGLGLCAFEIFVFPGHFVSLILGTLMVVFGLVMTFVGREPTGIPGWLPSMQSTWHGIQNGLLAVLGAVVCWFFLSMWLRRYLPNIPYFNKLILTATAGNTAALPAPGDKVRQDSWPFVGTIGMAATDLRPGGAAEFPYADATRSTPVVSADGYVPQGAKVVVEDIQGSSVRVRIVA